MLDCWNDTQLACPGGGPLVQHACFAINPLTAIVVQMSGSARDKPTGRGFDWGVNSLMLTRLNSVIYVHARTYEVTNFLVEETGMHTP